MFNVTAFQRFFRSAVGLSVDDPRAGAEEPADRALRLREEREVEGSCSSPPEGSELADEPGGDGPSTGMLREVERAARQVVENASGTLPGLTARHPRAAVRGARRWVLCTPWAGR